MYQFNLALIVDIQREGREQLRRLAERAFPGIVVHSAADLPAAQQLLRRYDYHLLLVDVGSAFEDACRLIVQAHAQAVPAHVVAIADDCAEQRLAGALRAGAEGYLLKSEQPDEQVLRLRGLARGNPPLSPQVARQLLRDCARRAAPLVNDGLELTSKEREVLTVLARGVKVKQAAQDLGVSYNTVATHVKRLYSKLNVSTRAEATLAAARIGLVY